jgi:integrase
MGNGALTHKGVEALPVPTNGQRDYWDPSLRGFGVRVSQGGRRTYVLRYRIGGRQRRLTLGVHPRLSLADARDRAKDALREVAHDKDPADAKAAEREADTFAELADEYLKRHAVNKLSKDEDNRILNVYLLPEWRNRRAKDITRRNVKELLTGIVDRGSPVMANRVWALINKVFNFGIEEDIVEANPCHLVKRPGEERQRERVLTEDEIRAFWQALDGEPLPYRAFYRLALLTAQRCGGKRKGRGELLLMRWDELDLKGVGGRFPASERRTAWRTASPSPRRPSRYSRS